MDQEVRLHMFYNIDRIKLPILKVETKRLMIRDFTIEDYMDVFEYFSDPVVMKYIEPIYTETQTKEFIQKYGIDRKFVYAIEEKLLKKVIGHVIFHEYNEPFEYELGWIMNQKFQRKGYAKEASLALFEYGFTELKLNRIIAETAWENKQSIAAIESLGMKLDESYEEELPVWVKKLDEINE